MTHRFFDKHKNIKQERHIECCRWKNLVYARTLKCASEFFYKNFTLTAGWQPITYNDIDWQNNYVFSYIMDPIDRRHKGIAEFLIQTNTQHLLNIDDFGKIIKQVTCLDEHSASLHNIYGNRISQIKWLPIVNNHQIAIDATESLLSEHQHPQIAWNKHFEHTTKNYMDSTYLKVKELWLQDLSVSDYVRFYFEPDILLFREVLKKYNLQD